MKKIIKTLLSFIASFLVLLTISSCSFSSTITYPDAENYYVGDTKIEREIDEIDIDWINGKVNLSLHSENNILVNEEFKNGLDDDYKLHWCVEGKKLLIKFALSGVKHYFYNTSEKELNVSIPESLNLENVKINCTSANVYINYIEAENITINSVSGKVDLNCKANNVNLTTTSGEISFYQEGDSDSLNIKTTSGKINAKFDNVKNCSLKSSSGLINVEGKSIIEQLNLQTSSGNTSATFDENIEKLKFQSTSGNLTLNLNENINFTLYINTTSGHFNSNLSLIKQGNTYTYKNGDKIFDIKTTSGNITINKK